MGDCVFTLQFSDRGRQLYCTEKLVDFAEWLSYRLLESLLRWTNSYIPMAGSQPSMTRRAIQFWAPSDNRALSRARAADTV